MLSEAVAINNPFPWVPSPQPETPLGRFKMREYHMNCHLSHAIELRLQEGFQLHDFVFDTSMRSPRLPVVCRSCAKADGSMSIIDKEELVARLLLGWQPDVTIEYWLSCSLASTRKNLPGKPGLASSTGEIRILIYLIVHRDMLHRLDSQNRHVRTLILSLTL